MPCDAVITIIRCEGKRKFVNVKPYSSVKLCETTKKTIIYTTMSSIRNEYINGIAQVQRFRYIVKEAKLRWFGQMQRRDAGDGVAREEKRKVLEKVY